MMLTGENQARHSSPDRRFHPLPCIQLLRIENSGGFLPVPPFPSRKGIDRKMNEAEIFQLLMCNLPRRGHHAGKPHILPITGVQLFRVHLFPSSFFKSIPADNNTDNNSGNIPIPEPFSRTSSLHRPHHNSFDKILLHKRINRKDRQRGQHGNRHSHPFGRNGLHSAFNAA